MKFITQIKGITGSGKAKTVFSSGAVSTDLQCAQFFMTLQDKDASLEDAWSYANIGPRLSPAVDWDEINRILNTFSKSN